MLCNSRDVHEGLGEELVVGVHNGDGAVWLHVHLCYVRCYVRFRCDFICYFRTVFLRHVRFTPCRVLPRRGMCGVMQGYVVKYSVVKCSVIPTEAEGEHTT